MPEGTQCVLCEHMAAVFACCAVLCIFIHGSSMQLYDRPCVQHHNIEVYRVLLLLPPAALAVPVAGSAS